jgi:hypothetical protein
MTALKVSQSEISFPSILLNVSRLKNISNKHNSPFRNFSHKLTERERESGRIVEE